MLLFQEFFLAFEHDLLTFDVVTLYLLLFLQVDLYLEISVMEFLLFMFLDLYAIAHDLSPDNILRDHGLLLFAFLSFSS